MKEKMTTELSARVLDLASDEPRVLLHPTLAAQLDVHVTDCVLLVIGQRHCVAAVDITAAFGIDAHAIGLNSGAACALGCKEHDLVAVTPLAAADSVSVIRNKLDGKKLTQRQFYDLVEDIAQRRITQVELAYFIAACSVRGLSFDETVALTRALISTGTQLSFDKSPVIDKHCIGGVPGNRTSLITVPILAALGYTVPKTSSRAITSPAGTADTMEVLAHVDLTAEQVRTVIRKTGGCIVWGGSVNLAPADDRIIRVERPLGANALGLMLSSVMAKKISAGSTHVVLDIPYGYGSKIPTLAKAKQLRSQFLRLGKRFGVRLLVLLTDGSQPVGDGVGPLLEAYDVLSVLRNESCAPQDLREKSLHIAGQLLEFIGHCEKKKGYDTACEVLQGGAAYRKFQEIIAAQGKKELPALAKFRHDVLASSAGTVRSIDNRCVTRICRAAGAPASIGAGMLLYAKKGSGVAAGQRLYAIYAQSQAKLEAAVAAAKAGDPYRIS
jgi:thymidine phosphorylase